MYYKTYIDLKILIDSYLKSGKIQILDSIQNFINTKEGCRGELRVELMNGHPEYIQLFSTEEQVNIVMGFEEKARWSSCTADKVSSILMYVSRKALNEILNKFDDVALSMIMDEVQKTIKIIGKRYRDLNDYPRLKTTNVFSRMCERIAWHWLYRKCKKAVKRKK